MNVYSFESLQSVDYTYLEWYSDIISYNVTMATESWHTQFFINLSEIMTFDNNSKYICGICMKLVGVLNG